MNAKQKNILEPSKNWKDEIYRESRETVENLQDSIAPADMSDRATQESEKSLELKSRDRQRKLIAKIDAALARIENGSYSYCEVTGEPINIERLDARPVTTLVLKLKKCTRETKSFILTTK